MVNTQEFISRIKEIIEQNDLSASNFAEKLGVQRATISHLLSGRNKPSLDFILKINNTFPEVNLYWLLNGTGNYLKSDQRPLRKENQNPIDTPTLPQENLFSESEKTNEVIQEIDSSNTNETIHNIASISQNIDSSPKNNSAKKLERIILLYTDGSFESYTN